MAATERKPDNTSTCPRCGAGLRCGMVAGDIECWCVQFPQVMPVPSPANVLPANSAAACFCPACLKKIIDERQHLLFNSAD